MRGCKFLSPEENLSKWNPSSWSDFLMEPLEMNVCRWMKRACLTFQLKFLTWQWVSKSNMIIIYNIRGHQLCARRLSECFVYFVFIRSSGPSHDLSLTSPVHRGWGWGWDAESFHMLLEVSETLRASKENSHLILSFQSPFSHLFPTATL